MNRAYAKVMAGSLCLLLSQAAASQDNVATQEATARFKAGLAQVRSGQREKARLSFLQAYAVLPNVDILWNLAVAEIQSGHVIEGLDHLDRFERDPDALPRELANLPMVRERAYKEIGRIQVEAPAGAKVSIDGGAQTSALVINVMPGDHVVRVQMDERSEDRPLTVPAGKLVIARFTSNESLSGTAAAPAPPATALAPVAASQPAVVTNADPPSQGSPNLTLGWVGMGITASALGLGIGYAVAAKNKNVEAAEHFGPMVSACSYEAGPPACAEVREAVNQSDRMSRVSTVSFVSAGVFAIATGGYFLLARSRGGVAVLPYGGMQQGGLAVSGQF